MINLNVPAKYNDLINFAEEIDFLCEIYQTILLFTVRSKAWFNLKRKISLEFSSIILSEGESTTMANDTYLTVMVATRGNYPSKLVKAHQAATLL